MMRCSSLAEMPLRRALISKIARNQTLKGFFVFSSSVPDVSEVWWPQSAHSNSVPPRSSQVRVLSQHAHRGVPLQRAWIQYARQASSVANRFSKSSAVFGKLRQRSCASCVPCRPPRQDARMLPNRAGTMGIGMLGGALVHSEPSLAQAAYCEGYARDYAAHASHGGALGGGAARGGIGGAIVGGIIDGGKGAGRSAGIGAIVGGVTRGVQSSAVYDEAFRDCMRRQGK